MEVSPVRNSKSGSSDFSIERILSDETSGREAPGAPSWLCCTRYRPPRLPLRLQQLGSEPNLDVCAGSCQDNVKLYENIGTVSTACRSRRSGRHARVPFTATQAAALEAAYGRAPYLAPPALRALAAALQLRDDRIKIWFQNRRARERREKCSAISPPQAVRLPPTPRSVTAPWTTHSIDEPVEFNSQAIITRNLHRTSSSEGEYSRDRLLLETRRDSSEGRPESPLDIETVDE